MSWLSGWDKRIKLTIDCTKIDANQTHFPVAVILSSVHGAEVFTELSADANRKKVAFTKVDGETQLYAEIEQFDFANQKAVYHVSASGWNISSAADTDFYMYYDVSQAENTTYIGDVTETPAQAVWDSDFKAVYHMAQDPNGDVANAIKDSTINANHGTPVGAMTSADLVDGKIGKGIDFDGSNDYINCANILGALLDTIYTLECVAKTDVINEVNIFLGYRSSTSSNPILFQLDHNNADVRMLVRDDAGNIAVASKASVLTITNHFYIVGVRNGSDVNIYVDTSIGTPDTDTFGAITENQFNIGAVNPGAPVDLATVFNGIIGEVRISNIVRSAAWIKATYHSLWDSLLTYGGEEEASPTITITEASVIFVGQIKDVAFKGAAAKINCVGFEHFLKQTIPKWRYQLTCNHMIFDSKCTKAEADYKTTTTVTLDSTGTQLTSADFDALEDGYFTGGKVVFGDEARTIVNHVGSIITLIYKMKELEDNNSVDAYPGCDGRIETCKDKFNNILNHLGFSHIPVENPALRVSW